MSSKTADNFFHLSGAQFDGLAATICGLKSTERVLYRASKRI